MKINLQLAEGVPELKYAKEGDAGVDLTTREALTIEPHSTVMVHTGVRMEIPEGYYGAVVPRSGISSKRFLAPINSPGTIDSGYRGEILVPLHNFGDVPQEVEAGERVAQLIIQQYARCEFVVVDELTDSERGAGGFGSTGRQ